METEIGFLLPSNMEKTAGKTKRVQQVDASNPPITARPKGACICEPSSNANAIGSMPVVIAQAVMMIGLSLPAAPCTAASVTVKPSFQRSFMKVIIITELDTETPMHMIEPMKDSMLRVVLVSTNAVTTPVITPGTAPIEVSANLGDWK